MEKISKQKTGFRFGKYRLTPGEIWGNVEFDGRKYRIQMVSTEEGKKYVSIKLYNKKGKFIKQLLIEPEIVDSIGKILLEGGIHAERGDREAEEYRPHLLS